ncbi:MAG: sensor histidine kinase [Bacteroidota bacterium]|nr:sensor histidine kinase [Bacteroidota bacterium]
MKIIYLKNQLLSSLHLLFWFISFNFWNVVLNPGVESTSVIQGFEVEWDFILLVNFVFLLYCSLPFIWMVRKKWLWIKIPVSILFLIPLGYVIVQWIKPDQNKEDVQVFTEYFVKNFLYVVVFHLTIVAAVYFNLKVLIVRFLNQSRFGTYLAYSAGLCLLTAILNFAFFDYFIDKLFSSLYYISYFRIWELVLIVAAYLVFTGILFLIGQYALMLIANRDAARNELSALKGQINPHFLFNNLNTIYSMASQKDDRTPEVILKLSDFLRYVLYDTSSETIPLEKEVEIIQTYVGLQKERVNPEITQVLLTTEGNFSGVNIAPLLLLPLAENCFKHGVGKNTGTIRIFISYDGKNLTFNTENQIALREKTDRTENGGLGIPNVEKRLNLIYPDRHSIEYQEKDGIFHLEMKVKLDK